MGPEELVCCMMQIPTISGALAARRWITDLLSSVHTSRHIPAGAVLGPCALKHTSLCDSIAFIALKCSDRRSVPYTLQVDTSSSGECLKLIQSARNAEEQNLEAYMKNGHLFFRALRDIPENTELLTWYGKDLAKLLGLSSAQKSTKGFICCECKQSFLFEFPLLAHKRFLCTGKPTSISNRNKLIDSEILALKSKPSTDFHNLARDLENCRKKNLPADSTSKRRHSFESESESDDSDEEPAFFDAHRDEKVSVKRLCVQGVNGHCWSQSSNPSFNEGRNSSHSPTHCHDNKTADPKDQDLKPSTIVIGAKPKSHTIGSHDVSDDIISTNEDRKSEFKPNPPIMPHIPLMITSSLTNNFIPTRMTAIPSILPLTLPQALNLQSSVLLHRDFPKQTLFHNTNLLQKSSQLHQQQTTALQSLLPPTIPSLGLPLQNWCAKCNISFHMTSDLVQHMRSHHKRTLADERQKRQREDRLKCPICNEAFRERHHLSRHMTSHI